MAELGCIRREHKLPVQSHLSENTDEVELVKYLRPDVDSCAEAYDKDGLLGGDDAPAIMAHCVWSDSPDEIALYEVTRSFCRSLSAVEHESVVRHWVVS